MLSAFRCHARCCIHLGSLNHWGLHHCNPLELPMEAYVQPGDGHWPIPGIHRVDVPCTALSRGASCYSVSCPPSIPTIWWSIQVLGLGRELCSSSTFPASGEESSSPGLVPSDDTVDSESLGHKPGDSGVVTGYQVYELTHTWSAEQFVGHPHIYPGFISKVSSLTHFPQEPWCGDYSFLDQSSCQLWTGLGFHPHWFHWAIRNWTHPWMSLMPLCLQFLLGFSIWLVLFLIILNCSLLLALSLINCGDRVGPFLCL